MLISYNRWLDITLLLFLQKDSSKERDLYAADLLLLPLPHFRMFRGPPEMAKGSQGLGEKFKTGS